MTMRQPLPTQKVEGVDDRGNSAIVTVDVRDDGRIALTSSASPHESVAFTAEQAACLRSQLGDALTVALRDAQTTREVNPS